jgi:dihydrolipoamide dehydrogenase
MKDKYQLVVLGSGSGGYVAALKAARLGARVALVEKDLVGGVCLNKGCIPTKVMLESAHRYHLARHSQDYGVNAEKVSFDFTQCFRKREEVVSTLRSGLEKLIAGARIDLLRGKGRLLPDRRVDVEGVGVVSADKIILATGSRTGSLPGLEIDGKFILDSDQLLARDTMPKFILIIGGGAVGLEFANFYAACGSEVHIVEIMEQILPSEERRIASGLSKYLQELGVKIYLKTTVERVEGQGSSVKVTLKDGRELSVECVLLSVGRRPVTDEFREVAGIEMDEKGNVMVDDYLETGLPGVYAVGDILKSPALAHLASHEGITAVRNALGGRVKMDYSAVPNVVYTFMEVARVGATEEELKARGVPYRSGQFGFRPIGRALAMGMPDGVVRMHIDSETGRLLGASVLAPHAGDLIAELTLAVREKLSFSSLAELIYAHPTLSEAIGEAGGTLGEGAIHGL